jgi:beta-glucosidase-like glycosyl hydrolase
VLKNEWGFKGVMQSDWGGTHSMVAAALAGLDEEQPGGARSRATEEYARINRPIIVP